MRKPIAAVVCLILALFAAVFPGTALANSAEPPQFTVIVSNAPDDLTLSINFSGGTAEGTQLHESQKGWEKYYRFYHSMSSLGITENSVLVVQSGETSFACKFPQAAAGQYNYLLTLDYKNQTLTSGQTFWRMFSLIGLRVVLTLLIEGLIFFLFRYRQKASWTAFVVINLITQGLLNILLSGPGIELSYWVFAFGFYELIIFIAESIAFASIVKEKSKGMAVGYVWVANIASLVLGALLISYLPV